jgi:hypothetical protein
MKPLLKKSAWTIRPLPGVLSIVLIVLLRMSTRLSTESSMPSTQTLRTMINRVLRIMSGRGISARQTTRLLLRSVVGIGTTEERTHRLPDWVRAIGNRASWRRLPISPSPFVPGDRPTSDTGPQLSGTQSHGSTGTGRITALRRPLFAHAVRVVCRAGYRQILNTLVFHHQDQQSSSTVRLLGKQSEAEALTEEAVFRAYEQGYADGVLIAEKMRWQGTPIGNLLQKAHYQPERDYRIEYETGFAHAMENAGRSEWVLLRALRGAGEELHSPQPGDILDETYVKDRGE